MEILVSNDSFSFCYNLPMEVIKNEKRYLRKDKSNTKLVLSVVC